MRVIGLNGSHRREGNTGIMLAAALEVCESNGFDVEQVDLVDKDIGYCTVCDACKKAYTCTVADDVIDVLDRLIAADGILVASPVYFGGVTGRLRAFYDRTLPARRNGMRLSGKVGAALSVGGSRNGGQEYAIHEIQKWMLIHEMTVVGDKQTAHFGGICTARNPGSVKDDAEGMKTVLNTAENLCERLK